MANSPMRSLLTCSLATLLLTGCAQSAMFFDDHHHDNASASYHAPHKKTAATPKQLTEDEQATRLSRAKQYFNQEDYELAYSELKPLAELGNADAQYGVGYMLYYGMGVRADKPSGITWISKSAKQAFPSAERALELLKEHNKASQHAEKMARQPQAKTEIYNPTLNKHRFALNDTSLLDSSTNHPADQTIDAFKDVTNLANKVYSKQTKEAILARLGAAIQKDNKPLKTYGPTRATDTLWHIAKEHRPNRNISIAQMMMAILKYNPTAFTTPNINALKKDVVLTMPPLAFIQDLNAEQMLGELIAQNDAWPKKSSLTK